MQSNSLWAAVNKMLAVVIVALIVTLVLASTAWATEYKVIYTFSQFSDGQWPDADLIFDTLGNLYGVTGAGDGGNCMNGCGTVFKLSPNPDGTWTKTVLYFFKGTGSADGGAPYGRLIFDGSGNLYGTTVNGGLFGCHNSFGCGTVFKLIPSPDGTWTETVLYRFHKRHGFLPQAGLIFDATGNLYGTTSGGGAYGWGTVFKLTPNPDGSWSEELLHNFGGEADGANPIAPLLFDSGGNLYGTASQGGTYSSGTVFKLAPQPDGHWKKITLHDFSSTDGANPSAGLISDTAGNLYGTSDRGGSYGYGTVFKLTPQPDGRWKKTTLHPFKGSDGKEPHGGVIFDTAGDLYGTAVYGGAYDHGTVYKLKLRPDGGWTAKVLHNFASEENPCTRLTFDLAGNLYGTTHWGPNYGGVIYEITP